MSYYSVLCYNISAIFLHLSSLSHFDRVEYYWKSLVKCKFFLYQSIICASSLKNVFVIINPLTTHQVEICFRVKCLFLIGKYFMSFEWCVFYHVWKIWYYFNHGEMFFVYFCVNILHRGRNVKLRQTAGVSSTQHWLKCGIWNMLHCTFLFSVNWDKLQCLNFKCVLTSSVHCLLNLCYIEIINMACGNSRKGYEFTLLW